MPLMWILMDNSDELTTDSTKAWTTLKPRCPHNTQPPLRYFLKLKTIKKKYRNLIQTKLREFYLLNLDTAIKRLKVDNTGSKLL